MTLTAVLIVIIIITLFAYFIRWFTSDEEQEAQRFETRTSNRVQEQPTFQVSSTLSAIPQPYNIGFNLNGGKDPVAPVGAAPTGAYQTPYPPYPSNMTQYPSAAAPYPPDTSSGYPPVGVAAYSIPNPSAPVCTTNPSAPITDSQPPSYNEATGQYPSSSRQQPPYPLN